MPDQLKYPYLPLQLQRSCTLQVLVCPVSTVKTLAASLAEINKTMGKFSECLYDAF